MCTVDSNSDWISIHTRMPKLNEYVLVWVYGDYYIGHLSEDSDSSNLRWWFDEFDLSGEEMEDVEAWMPLPKPYRGTK